MYDIHREKWAFSPPVLLFMRQYSVFSREFRKSFAYNLFADPHSINPVVSYFYKSMGEGVRQVDPGPGLQPLHLPHIQKCKVLSPSSATLPRGVSANQPAR